MGRRHKIVAVFLTLVMCLAPLLEASAQVKDTGFTSNTKTLYKSQTLEQPTPITEETLKNQTPSEPENNQTESGINDLIKETQKKEAEKAALEKEALPLKEPTVDPEIEAEKELEASLGTLVSISKFEKTFETAPNKFKTITSMTPYTYQNEKGKEVVIDNTLGAKTTKSKGLFNDAEKVYENRANAYKLKLPEAMKEGKGFTIEQDGVLVEFIPDTEKGDFTKSKTKENAILYNEVYPGIDFMYTAYDTSVKEDIILNRVTDQNTFEYEIKGDNLKVVQDGTVIRIFKKEDVDDKGQFDVKKEVLNISAPYMADQAGEINTEVTLTLEEKAGKNTLTLTADKDWIQDPSRVYPIKIDPIINAYTTEMAGVEQYALFPVVGDNGYLYIGKDDGVKSGTNQYPGTPLGHGITRIFARINTPALDPDARINSARFYMKHTTRFSGGTTQVGLYSVDDGGWSQNTLSYANQPINHTFYDLAQVGPSGGTTVSWDMTTLVNEWFRGIKANRGFVFKAIGENTMQAEAWSTPGGGGAPLCVIDWELPPPVDPNYPINDLTIFLKQITEKNISGKLKFDGVFVDGVTKPNSLVSYKLTPESTNFFETVIGSRYYKYPNSEPFDPYFPEGNKYNDRKTSWQGNKVFTEPVFNTLYRFLAKATDGVTVSDEKSSDSFIIYQVKQKDTFPTVANYYGVPLAQIMADNKVQDQLMVENNTLFIRNPSKNETNPYNPPPLTDAQKREIDGALMGRGLHCEYGFEPINLNTGNFLYESEDVNLPELGGDFSFTRTYNSKGDLFNGRMGMGWEFNHSESLSKLENGTIAYFKGDGKYLYFKDLGNNTYQSPDGFFLDLKSFQYTVGTGDEAVTYTRYEMRDKEGTLKKFNLYGLLETTSDVDGNTTSYTYDAEFKLTKITLPSGKAIDVVSDENGRISKVLLPNGTALEYTYDDKDNLIEYKDGAGYVTKYAYDKNHCMTSWTDANGDKQVQNTYDSEGRVTKQIDARGKVAILDYTNHTNTTVDGNGNETTYTFDEGYRTTKIDYPDGTTVTKSYYDTNNLLKSETDQLGVTTTYAYDSKGNVVKAEKSNGTFKAFEYNSLNLQTKETDENGHSTLRTYDEKGNLLTETDPLGYSLAYTYDGQSRLLSAKDKNGYVTTYTYEGVLPNTVTDGNGKTSHLYYDAMGRLTALEDPEQGVSRTTYEGRGGVTSRTSPENGVEQNIFDPAGDIIATIDANGNRVDFKYDAMGNPTKVVDPLGGTTTFEYDGNGNEIKQTYGDQREILKKYDEMNRLIQVTDPDGGKITYEYDGLGHVISQTDENGHISKAEVDPVTGKVTKEILPGSGVLTYTYDKVGNLLTKTFEDGKVITYTYDAGNQVKTFKDEAGLLQTFEYDGNGNTLRVKNDQNNTLIYTYDGRNNKLSETDYLGAKTQYAYDYMGNVTQEVNPLNETTTYEYTKEGRLAKSISPTGKTTSIEYDLKGNPIKTVDGNGNITENTYDGLNRLSQVKNPLGHITAYTYDENENLSAVTDALGKTTKYTYNGKDQVIKEEDARGFAVKKNYDPKGNLITSTDKNNHTTEFFYNEDDQVIKTEDGMGLTKTYSYDKRYRLLEEKEEGKVKTTYDYNDKGQLVKETNALNQTTEYTYNPLGFPTTFKNVDGLKTKFEYDANGNLLKEMPEVGNEKTYTYDLLGRQIATEEKGEKTGTLIKQATTYDPDGNVIETLDALAHKKQYSYDENNQLIKEINAKGDTHTLTYDALGNVIEETDERGSKTIYSYNALNQVIKQKLPEGGVKEWAYDAIGNLIKEKDPLGNLTTHTYDGNGNLTKTLSPKGAVTKYAYNAHNQMVETEDPNQNKRKYDYDLKGNLLKETLPNGGGTTYAYDALNRMISYKEKDGDKKTYTYDDANDMIKETLGNGATTQYTYDKQHRVKIIQDAENNETKLSYDEFSNVNQVTTPEGATTKYSYDELGKLTKEIGPNGLETQMTYDELGNTIQTSQIGKTAEAVNAKNQTKETRTTQSQYDSGNNLVKVIDPMEQVDAYTYDKESRQTSKTDSLGNTSTTAYDQKGNVTRQVDKMGASKTFTYDSHGNLEKETDELGNATQFSYDLKDNLVGVKEPENKINAYTYDKVGNLIKRTNPNGGTTTFGYDLAGKMTQMTDPLGNTTKYAYDEVGNQTKVEKPDGKKLMYKYDRLGNLLEKDSTEGENLVLYHYDGEGKLTDFSDPKGDTQYEYDEMGHITKATAGDGSVIQYAYDDFGNLANLTYPDGKKVLYTYDKKDRLTQITDRQGKVTTYTYDKEDQIIGIKRPDNLNTTYTYDKNGHVVTLTNQNTNGTTLSTFAYTYDQRGDIIKETTVSYNSKGTNPITTEKTFEYNKQRALTGYTESDNKGNKSTTRYSYDEAGNRISLKKGSTLLGSSASTYTYNQGDQLVKEEKTTNGKTKTIKYEYDQNGNQTKIIGKKEDVLNYEYDVENRLTAIKQGKTLLMAAGYDGLDNRLFTINRITEKEYFKIYGTKDKEPEKTDKTKPKKESLTFNYTKPKNTAFKYGVMQSLVNFVTSLSPVSGTKVSKDFQDKWKLLVGGGFKYAKDTPKTKTKDNKKPELADVFIPYGIGDKDIHHYELRNYINDINQENTQVLMEYSASGSPTAAYTYGNGQCLTYENQALKDGNPNKISTYLYDGRGSVTQLASNGGQNIVNYSYDANGNATSDKASYNAFAYNGEAHDLTLTDMQYLRARYYEADTARFTQRDTYLGELIRPVSLNQYTYVENNPLAYTDPDGHKISSRSSIAKKATGGSALSSLVNAMMAGIYNGAAIVHNTLAPSAPKLKLATTGKNWQPLANPLVKNNNINVLKILKDKIRKSCTTDPKISLTGGSSLKDIKFSNQGVLGQDRYSEESRLMKSLIDYLWENSTFSGKVHGILDIIGMFIDLADPVNAFMYLIEGDFKNAALSGAATIPILGWGALVIKDWAKLRKAENAVDTLSKIERGFSYSGVRKLDADFNNGNKLTKHFDDHKMNFGYKTETQYLDGARKFLDKPPTATTQSFTSDSGWYFRYDTATNEFGIINEYGGISTYFKPDAGMNYWLDQISKYAPK